MEHRDQAMSLMNRPDERNERRREEARRLRANQARPLVEPETAQVFQGDSTFNRVTVPLSELDDFTKSIMEVLGPYHNLLGGPTINGPRALKRSTTVEVDGKLDAVTGSDPASSSSGQQQLPPNPRHTSSSTNAKHVNSLPGGDSKHPSSLSLSHPTSSSSVIASKPAKPTLLTPVVSSSLSSTSQKVVTLPSSPTTLTQSPGRSGISKDSQMAPKDSDGHKEVKLTSHQQTTSAASLSLKHKISSKSSRSPRKDASSQQAPPYSHSSSKSRLPSQSSSALAEHTKLVSQVATHNQAQLFHSSFNKDHSSSNNNNNPFKTINASSAAIPPPVTSSSAAAAGNGRPSPSASLASMSHISPSNQTKTDLSPPVRPKSSFSDRTHIIPSPRPRSATPTKIKPYMPNGITSQHIKLSPAESLSTHALNDKAALTDKVDKTKSLKLCMPYEKKIPTTKSDLIDIFKEMAEVHAPLTAIETPQKVDGQFPFYASGSLPDGKRNIDFSTGLLSAKEDTKKFLASEASKAGKENQKAATSQNEATLSLTPAGEAAVVTKEVKVEEKPSVEPGAKEGLSGKVKNAPAEVAPVRYSSSSLSHAPRHRSIGKTMSDDNSILMRDLDLSEDSDVEQASEDNVSECQSKKGKVISASAGVAVKRAVSPMSSSSSSSSSSSGSDSESGGDDDTDNEGDDDGKEKTKERDVEVKKSSERRLSSSSSSTSSESDLGSEGEDNDEEVDGEDKESEGKKAEHTEIRLTTERGDKTPSPAYKQAAIMKASLDTPSKLVPENSDTSLSWRLDNFMKKSSPAGISPLKSAASPPTSHSAPPSVQPKDEVTAKTPDQNRPRTLKDVGQRDTMSFEVQARKVPGSGGDNMAEDNYGDDDSEMFSVNNSSVSSKKDCDSLLGLKTSSSSKQSVHRKSALSTEENSRKVTAKGDGILPAQKFVDPLRTDSVRGLKSSSSSSKKELKRTDSPAGVTAETTKTPSPLAKPKPVQPGSGSSSNDEIDVVNLTPDEKVRNRLPSTEKPTSKGGLLESSNVCHNGTLSESSDKDTQASPRRGKTVEKTHIKHHKTKEPLVGHASTSVSLSTSRSTDSSNALVASAKTTKTDSAMALDHLDAISKPPNLLSPLHSEYSSPPISSTRPLPPFHSSFPLHSSPSVMPPYVTLTRNADGTSRPKIVVQIRSSFLSKKVLSWVKEKKERRRKFNMETRVSESSKADEVAWDSAKGSKIPSNRSSGRNRESDNVGVPKNGEPSAASPTSSAHSMSSQPPRLGKNKTRDSSTSGRDILSSPHSKMPKYASSSSKEPHSSASSSSSSLSESSQNTHANKGSSSVVDVSTCAAAIAAVTSPRTRVAKRPPLSEQTSPSKVINSSAVKTLDFVEDRDINSDQSKSDKTKTFKRKMDIADEMTKKSKPDQPGDKGNSSAPAAIGKRRDSTNSTSSKGSHQSASSSAKKPRRISGNSKKDSSNNNSIDKASAPITNGPESSNLPFNLYVNGNGGSNGSVSSQTPSSSTPSALPANIPPPSPVETQLHSTKHYLARAREHKHHADHLKDKLAKFEPYLRSGLSFYLAGYTMELGHRELGTSYKMYSDTYGLLQYVVRMRANSSSNPDSSDRERKLIVLIIRLQAFLNHRMFRLRQAEVSKLKKVIESEQAKLHPSSTPSTTASSSTSANPAASSKPLAPSPHQAHWNKNSAGTPSPMSPTPSPAGSVSSQGSCELVSSKIQNGATSSSSTPLASPSPGMVSVHPRLHAVNQKYFVLTSHTVKSWELWDQADAESKGSEDFFTILDNACGPLSFHLDPPVIVRYMKHALRLLNL